jgi:hypothetical protein
LAREAVAVHLPFTADPEIRERLNHDISV